MVQSIVSKPLAGCESAGGRRARPRPAAHESAETFSRAQFESGLLSPAADGLPPNRPRLGAEQSRRSSGSRTRQLGRARAQKVPR